MEEIRYPEQLKHQSIRRGLCFLISMVITVVKQWPEVMQVKAFNCNRMLQL